MNTNNNTTSVDDTGRLLDKMNHPSFRSTHAHTHTLALEIYSTGCLLYWNRHIKLNEQRLLVYVNLHKL